MKKTIILLLILFLLPIASAMVTDILEQAKNETYGLYQLKVLYIGQNKVKFQLNNMTSDLLNEDDLYRFEDGSYIYVREILEEEAKEGPDMVSFKFFPAKIPIITEPEIMENITENELPSIVPEIEEEIIEEEIPPEEEKEVPTPPPLPTAEEEIVVEEGEERELSLLEIIINWIKSLFGK